MERRAFIGTVAAGFLAAPLPAESQQALKIARIGYLEGVSAIPQNHEAFLQGLQHLGYVVGGNVVIEYRDPEGKYERLPDLGADVVALKVDVIVVSGTPMPRAAKQSTSAISIVFVAVDPVSSGLVSSLARPGGNLTGLASLIPDLVGKCLELFRRQKAGSGL